MPPVTRFTVGDVLFAKYPFNDGTGGWKPRPCIVLEETEEGIKCLACQVTSTMRSEHNTGITIVKDTPEYNQMGLRSTSFINLDDIAELTLNLVERRIGTCPPEILERLLILGNFK